MGEVDRLLPELELIGDEALRTAVREIWADCWADSSWPELAGVPKGVALPERTLVAHTRSVARLALAAAETMQAVHGIGFDRDVLLAGALLHDVSKLWETSPAAAGRCARPRAA